MIKGMQALNLVREFEMQKMKESETIKEYANMKKKEREQMEQ